MRHYFRLAGKVYTGGKRGRRAKPENESQLDTFDEFCENQMHKIFNRLFVTTPYGPPAWTAQQQQLFGLRRHQRTEMLALECDVCDFEYRK